MSDLEQPITEAVKSDAVATPRRGLRVRSALLGAAAGSFAVLAVLSLPLALGQETIDEIGPPPPTIDHEALWPAQAELVKKALDGVSLQPDRTDSVVIAVGADGGQRLFGREAKEAARTLGARFYGPSVVLSNDIDDLSELPLATNTNLRALLAGLARRMEPRDHLVLYLTSHGSRDAELSTGLPDYTPVQPISARSLAGALRIAGLKRSTIIVSACYSGSWIAPLAGVRTIVITAAAADRTSFGCDDSRELTFFGEAFLRGPITRGASLQQAFVAAQKSVAKWEAGIDAQPSMPQAKVGREMAATWRAAKGRAN